MNKRICTFTYAFPSLFFLILLGRVRLQNFSPSSIKTNKSTETSVANNFYLCSPIHEERMVARCPEEYNDKDVVRKCEKGLASLDDEDFSTIIPATNFDSNIVYANRYCAICHNDSSYELWEATISWPTDAGSPSLPERDAAEILSTLRYDATSRRYVVGANNSTTVPCSFEALKPQNSSDSSNSSDSRSCPITYVVECPSVSGEPPIDCYANFSGDPVCTTWNYFYANAQCARCNNYEHEDGEHNRRQVAVSCDVIAEKFKKLWRTDAASTLFKLKKSPRSNACSIPAVAKYYC